MPRPEDDIIAQTDTIENYLLDGKIRLLQPCEGYRAAIDPILLAAMVQPTVYGAQNIRVLELGCGVGSALLCLAYRLQSATITGLELHPMLRELAMHNIRANEFDKRAAVIAGDLRDHRQLLKEDGFDWVIANPPFLREGHHRPPPNSLKALAFAEGSTTLIDWIKAAAYALKRRGQAVFVQRTDRMDEMVTLLKTYHFGDLTLVPLWPKAFVESKRMLIIARSQCKSPSRILPGLILHQEDGLYTEKTERILRGGAGYFESISAASDASQRDGK